MIDTTKLTNIEIQAISRLFNNYVKRNIPESNWHDKDGKERSDAIKEYVRNLRSVENDACLFVKNNLMTEIDFYSKLMVIQSAEIDDTERTRRYKEAKSKYESELIW